MFYEYNFRFCVLIITNSRELERISGENESDLDKNLDTVRKKQKATRRQVLHTQKITKLAIREPDEKRKPSRFDNFTDNLSNTGDPNSEDPSWQNEKRWASILIEHITKINLRFALDRLTKGNGSCLMIACMQQLRRADIFSAAKPEVQELARNLDHRDFRKKVKLFAVDSKDPRMVTIKENYDRAKNAGIEKKSWEKYWEDMLEDSWADNYFIQAAAYYMGFNIRIITTASTEVRPYLLIECGEPGKETLWIGHITDLHYQSIIPENSRYQIDRFGEEMKDEPVKDPCPVCQKMSIVLKQHLQNEGEKDEEILKLRTLLKKTQDSLNEEKNKSKKLVDQLGSVLDQWSEERAGGGGLLQYPGGERGTQAGEERRVSE